MNLVGMPSPFHVRFAENPSPTGEGLSLLLPSTSLRAAPVGEGVGG